MDRFGHTQERLAEARGQEPQPHRQPAAAADAAGPVRGIWSSGKLTAGHARALVTADAPGGPGRQVVERDLSVRQTEALARNAATPPAGPRAAARVAAGKDADTRALEADHGEPAAEGQHRAPAGPAGRRAAHRYATLEELDGLCQLLSQ